MNKGPLDTAPGGCRMKSMEGKLIVVGLLLFYAIMGIRESRYGGSDRGGFNFDPPKFEGWFGVVAIAFLLFMMLGAAGYVVWWLVS
jgi:hypothetical protein